MRICDICNKGMAEDFGGVPDWMIEDPSPVIDSQAIVVRIRKFDGSVRDGGPVDEMDVCPDCVPTLLIRLLHNRIRPEDAEPAKREAAIVKSEEREIKNPPDVVSGQLAHDVGQVLDELVDLIDVAANGPRGAMMGHIVAISEIAKGDSPPAAEPAGAARLIPNIPGVDYKVIAPAANSAGVGSDLPVARSTQPERPQPLALTLAACDCGTAVPGVDACHAATCASRAPLAAEPAGAAKIRTFTDGRAPEYAAAEPEDVQSWKCDGCGAVNNQVFKDCGSCHRLKPIAEIGTLSAATSEVQKSADAWQSLEGRATYPA